MSDLALALRRLGGTVTGGVARLGYTARFLGAILWYTPMAFRRLHLTVREIYFSGVLSLVIILMSGLFVGMVLSLQGYEVLQRYGAAGAARHRRRAVAGQGTRTGDRRVCCSPAARAPRSPPRSA